MRQITDLLLLDEINEMEEEDSGSYYSDSDEDKVHQKRTQKKQR